MAARDSVKPAQIAQASTDAAGNYSIPRQPDGQARTFDTDTGFMAYVTEHFDGKSALDQADLVVAEQPCLIVKDLKRGAAEGALALWIGPGTEAHFRGLRVTPR